MNERTLRGREKKKKKEVTQATGDPCEDEGMEKKTLKIKEKERILKRAMKRRGREKENENDKMLHIILCK